MRKALQRAAQALVAAGAFGVAYPAVAQTPLPAANPARSAPAHAGVASGAQEAEASSPSQAKLEELQIELALLANPSTFAYPLAVKHTGDGVEVHGFVPSKYIKDQALETARKHCAATVIDKLHVNDAMMLRTAGGSAEELKQAAAALLADGAGPVTNLEIKAAAGGHLTLSGSCESHEQKVEISKKLRGLNGCCAVDNGMTVKPVLREGRMVTLVSADGAICVPENDGGVPAHHLAHGENKVASNGYSWLDAPSVPPSTNAGTTRKVAKMDLPPMPIGLGETKIETHSSMPPKAEPVPAVAMRNDLPPLPPADPEWSKGMQTHPVPAPSNPPPLPVAQAAATFASNAAPSTSPYAHVPAYASAPADATESVKAPAAVEHLPPPPAPVKPVPPPSAGWPAAHDAHPVQVAYATTGVVLFDDSLPEPPPLLTNDQAALLKQKVAAVCGAKAKSIFVETKPDGLHVHVQSAAKSEDEALARQIYALPEMGQNVKLHIELGK